MLLSECNNLPQTTLLGLKSHFPFASQTPIMSPIIQLSPQVLLSHPCTTHGLDSGKTQDPFPSQTPLPIPELWKLHDAPHSF